VLRKRLFGVVRGCGCWWWHGTAQAGQGEVGSWVILVEILNKIRCCCNVLLAEIGKMKGLLALLGQFIARRPCPPATTAALQGTHDASVPEKLLYE